ncbi:MAG: phosphoglycerate kinase [Candidatus Daviesbacteria bacterium]|nr:MAG: phosphoglycerate kinase [Candidatus Daviesbacteria bacterium]
MQVVSSDLVLGKKVLLRLDLDVPLRQVGDARQGTQGHGQFEVIDDFRLKAGLETVYLCLEHAKQVIIMGHIGRPMGREVPELSVKPIYGWFLSQGLAPHLEGGRLKLLENLRFEEGEEKADLGYAKELAKYGDFFVNEAFASFHPAASTTVLPTLLPHAAGLHFAKEVEKLTKIRINPHHPLVVIVGGAKKEDKIPFIQEISKIADQVLVGGKMVSTASNFTANVLVATLNEDGLDITEETINSWKEIIKAAGMIVWNGPMGRVEEGKIAGTKAVAEAISESWAEVIIGGGDTVGFLAKEGLLEKFEHQAFISTGGGAMLEFLSKGTLPTIEALK